MAKMKQSFVNIPALTWKQNHSPLDYAHSHALERNSRNSPTTWVLMLLLLVLPAHTQSTVAKNTSAKPTSAVLPWCLLAAQPSFQCVRDRGLALTAFRPHLLGRSAVSLLAVHTTRTLHTKRDSPFPWIRSGGLRAVPTVTNQCNTTDLDGSVESASLHICRYCTRCVSFASVCVRVFYTCHFLALFSNFNIVFSVVNVAVVFTSLTLTGSTNGL